MKKVMVALLALAPGLGLGGCRTTQVSSGEGSTTLPNAPAEPGLVPAGATLKVSLDQPLGADTNQVGDHFTAHVQSPLRAPDGAVVVPAGAVVNGRVTELKRSSHVGEQAAISVDFDSIHVGGRSSPLAAKVVDTDVKNGAQGGGRAAKGAGIGAAGGAVLGAILGGGLGTAMLGGLAGAGAGTLIGLGTGEATPRLPAGTELSLQTTSPTRVAKVKAHQPL
jgi:hypothetical protein